MTDQTPTPSLVGEQLTVLDDEELSRLPAGFLETITDVSRYEEPEEARGAVGRTMFDTPGAHAGSITVLLPKDNIQSVPIQSMVRILSGTAGATSASSPQGHSQSRMVCAPMQTSSSPRASGAAS